MTMNIFKRFNSALDDGLTKAIFDHIRNFLICAFLLAVGANELREQSSVLLGFFPSKYSGTGVVGISCMLIILNLYDGIRRLSKSEYHLILIISLVTLYLFISVRVIEMAWNFRMPF